MKKYWALKNEKNFVPICDGKNLYYGGDQAWYGTAVRRHSACGTVAATNIAMYQGLFGTDNGGREISGGCTLKQFLFHMNQMYDFVEPLRIPFVSEDALPYKGFGWSFGVWPAGRFVRGMRRFSKAVGIFLTPILYRKNREVPQHFIERALKKDCPVALLIGTAVRLKNISVHYSNGRSFTQTDFSRHWVTVTAMECRGEVIYIKVSTWGGYAWLPLADCFYTTFIKSRMCYFILHEGASGL